MTDGTYLLDRSRVAVDKPANDSKVAISFGDKPVFMSGRRSWIKYRELGVTEATDGAMRAQVINSAPENTEPTGWHLHRCDLQFLYVVQGAMYLAFSPTDVVRLSAGDSVMIPGGTIHYELGRREGVQVIEVTLPAEIGTENVESPWGDVEIDFANARSISEPAAP